MAREAEIRALSNDPDLEARLIASFAPNIWEMDDVKRGLLAQLFGGVGKSFPGGRVRGEINALLVGGALALVHAGARVGMCAVGPLCASQPSDEANLLKHVCHYHRWVIPPCQSRSC